MAVLVGDVSPSLSTVEASPLSITTDGETSTITVTVVDAAGNPLEGAPVILGCLPAYFDMRGTGSFYDAQSYVINLAWAALTQINFHVDGRILCEHTPITNGKRFTTYQ